MVNEEKIKCCPKCGSTILISLRYREGCPIDIVSAKCSNKLCDVRWKSDECAFQDGCLVDLKDNLPNDLQVALEDAEKDLRELQSKRSPEEQRVIKQMLEKRKRKQGA